MFETIPDCNTVLPDPENGLVLLSHIAQHLEGGLGLRQILDWMMFVQSCVNDDFWYVSFQQIVRKTGLETLAKAITKMCQRHLDLTTKSITWCEDADDFVCDNLMKFVLESGNLGRREKFQSGIVSRIPSPRHAQNQ